MTHDPIATSPCRGETIDRVVRAARDAKDLGFQRLLVSAIDAALKSEDCAEAWSPDNLINAVSVSEGCGSEVAVMTTWPWTPTISTAMTALFEAGLIVLTERSKPWRKWRSSRQKQGPISLARRHDGRSRWSNPTRAGISQFSNVAICPIRPQYASCFYGPFRDAVAHRSPHRRQSDLIR